MTDAVRVFVALDLPAGAREAVAREVEVLRAAGADVRFVPVAKLHVTLKFCGDVARDVLPRLHDALGTVAWPGPLQLGLRGLGRFPPAGRGVPRVFWAGLDGDLDAVATLAVGVDAACATVGIARERRPFAPHVTFARVRTAQRVGALEDLVAAHGPDFVVAPVAVTGFVLYASELRPSGAVHTPLGAFPR